MGLNNVKRKEKLRELMRVSISFAVTFIVLIIIRVIILRLSYMDQVIANIFTVADIAAAVISVAFIVLVAIFSKILSRIIGELLPLFPGIPSLINNIMLIIIIIIAYSSFDTFIVPFFILHKIAWLYPIIFLLLAILPIYRIIVIIYRNVGNIVYLFRRKPTSSVKTGEGICPNCKAYIKNDAHFCSKCGTRIEKISKQEIDINRCSNCGYEIDMESDFCSNCGAKIEKLEKEKLIKNTCSNCGAEIEPNASFCSNCGKKIE